MAKKKDDKPVEEVKDEKDDKPDDSGKPASKMDAVKRALELKPDLTGQDLADFVVDEFGPEFKMSKEMAGSYRSVARREAGGGGESEGRTPTRVKGMSSGDDGDRAFSYVAATVKEVRQATKDHGMEALEAMFLLVQRHGIGGVRGALQLLKMMEGDEE